MSAVPRLPIRSVAVLGEGIVGLSAAIAFSRALPGLAVTVIPSAPDPAALADHMPGSLPSISDFHHRIGVTEEEVIAAGATHRVGIRFKHWTAEEQDFIHAFGDHGGPIRPGAFYQHWLNARRTGTVANFDAFSAAAALAREGKFVHPQDDPASPLSRFEYALRLDPLRYRELLHRHAERRRVAFTGARFAGIELRADGGVAALRLSDRRRIEADLFLDCAGPAAPVRSSLGTGFEDWSEALICDRLLIGEEPPRPLTSCDDVTGIAEGWRWAAPLRDRTMIGFAYASTVTPTARAERLFDRQAQAVSLRPGFRLAPWFRNVLALGDAAVAVDPLEWTNLHLAQSAIARALDLLPGRDCHPLEIAEYNHRTRQQAERARDFITAHYWSAKRRPGMFWKFASRSSPPESFRHTLDQFLRRGRLPHFEGESFGKESWLALLLGLDLVPKLADAITTTADPAKVKVALRALAASTAALPRQLPPYGKYLEELSQGLGKPW